MPENKRTLKKIPYKGGFSSAMQLLINEGLLETPKQSETLSKDKSYEKLVVVFDLNWGPTTFRENVFVLMSAAEAEAERLKKAYPDEKVKLSGRIVLKYEKAKAGKGRHTEEAASEYRDYGFHTTNDPEEFIWGPGYDIPHMYLEKATKDITKLIEKYEGKDKEKKAQVPFRIDRLVITIGVPV